LNIFSSKVSKAQRFFKYLKKTMASKFLPVHSHEIEKNGASDNVIFQKWILFLWIQLFELPSYPHIPKGLIPRRFKLDFPKKQTLMSVAAQSNAT